LTGRCRPQDAFVCAQVRHDREHEETEINGTENEKGAELRGARGLKRAELARRRPGAEKAESEGPKSRGSATPVVSKRKKCPMRALDPWQGKEHLSVVICGHVDAGKMTMRHRLMFELGGIGQREMERMRKEADELGKSSFLFAFYMDRRKEDRARGVTIASTTCEFFTETKHYTIIDAPGHRDFIKNLIMGASQADVALLLVPADGNFVTSIAKGNAKAGEMQGQSREHALLVNLLGVKHLIVGVNKMDCDVAKYRKERNDEVVEEVVSMLSKTGWGTKESVRETVPILPISAWVGDNLTDTSLNMPWWTGVDIAVPGKGRVHVRTLLEALEETVFPPARNPVGALRLPISGVYKIKGVGDVLTGRVEQGTVKQGMEVAFIPTNNRTNNCVGTVSTVEMHHKQLPEAGPSCNIGMHIKGLSKSNMPRVGDVMVLKSDEFEAARLVEVCVHEFAEVQVGDTLVCFVGTSRTSVEVIRLVWVSKCTVLLTLETLERGLACETDETCSYMAKVGLMKGGNWTGLGKVKNVERWSVRLQRAAQAAIFVIMAFLRSLSRDISRIIARLVFESRGERIWSVLGR
jgi:elongation factor 1-alpha